MSDVLKRIEEADAKIAELTQELKDLEVSARNHEEEARKIRGRRVEAKTERQQWVEARNSLGVRKAVEDTAASASKAKAAAEANEKKAADVLASVEKLKAELAAELEKAKVANSAKDSPAE